MANIAHIIAQREAKVKRLLRRLAKFNAETERLKTVYCEQLLSGYSLRGVWRDSNGEQWDVIGATPVYYPNAGVLLRNLSDHRTDTRRLKAFIEQFTAGH